MADAVAPLRVERASDRVIATLDRPATRNAIDQELVDALHALCAELEDRSARPHPHGRGRRVRVGRRHRPAARPPRRRRPQRHQHDGVPPHPQTSRCPSSPPSTAGRSAVAPSSPMPPTSASPRPRRSSATPRPASGSSRPRAPRGACPRSSGTRRASELLLTGRILTADEALAWGLVSSLHEPDDLLPAAWRSRTASRRTIPSRPATPRRRCSPPRTRTPRSSSSCRPSSSRVRRRCGA